MSRPYRLYPLRSSRDPLTAQELLDAPERTVQVRPPLTEQEREMRRLREALAGAAKRFAAILAAVERARSAGHAECLAELRTIDRAARLGLEVSHDA